MFAHQDFPVMGPLFLFADQVKSNLHGSTVDHQGTRAPGNRRVQGPMGRPDPIYLGINWKILGMVSYLWFVDPFHPFTPGY